jgi:hypothetical protein
LAIGAGLRLTQHSNFIVLVGKGNHRVFGIAGAVTIVTAITFAVASVLVLDAGLVGVAAGCCIPMALVSIGFLPIYSSRAMNIPIRRSLNRSWMPALLATTPAILLIFAWSVWRPPTTWIELLSAVAAAGLLILAGAWALALDTEERERLRRMLPI